MLYLSYIGRDIRNDAEFAPSSLISELLDTIAAMTGKSGRELSEKWVKHHPLQAFSRRYSKRTRFQTASSVRAKITPMR